MCVCVRAAGQAAFHLAEGVGWRLQRGRSVVASSEMQLHPEDPLMASLHTCTPTAAKLPWATLLNGVEKRGGVGGGRWMVAQWDRSLTEAFLTAEGENRKDE